MKEKYKVLCDNVSVKYSLGDFKDIGLKEYLLRRARRRTEGREIYANKDISISLEGGDMLGIIGRNGAGKSTLLKVIAGIIAPSEGRVETHGRVAALLELGSGFDGELSVRENTYLRGALLGYSRDFIDEKYREIINFAELCGAEERPFRQLSSGMKSRLAFSIASIVEPDILILDEVLAVGDGGFRKKSAERMRSIINSGSATILVSHSISDVCEICNKVLWLDAGRQIYFGKDVERVCREYTGHITLGNDEI